MPAAKSSSSAPGDRLLFNRLEGSARVEGARVVLVPEILLHTIQATLAEQLGDRAPDIAYRTGYEWGLQDMIALHRQLQEQYGASFDFWQMDAKFVLDTWWSALAANGWGAASFDVAALTRGLVFVDVKASPLVAIRQRTDRPACHLTAGLLAGAHSFYDRAERHAAEVRCAANGHEACTFVVGSGADVDSAEAWRKQGVSAADIRRRLGGAG